MDSSTNIPVYFFNPSYEEYNSDFYNVGIISIASYLNKKGIPAYVYMNYLDSEFTLNQDYDRILPTILAKSHAYVGISCMTAQMPAALDLSKRIKKISPNTPIVWGGSHANVFAEHLLQEHNFIDFCVRGSGEQTAELLYHYLRGENIAPENIPGLVYRKDRVIKINEWAYPKQEVYNQPMDYSLIVNFRPVERYFAGKPAREASIFNTIGCPYRCRFCINSVKHIKVIFRDLEVVISEIKQVLEKGVNTILFIDELFFVKFDRLDRFLDCILEDQLHFSWFAHARIDSINSNKLNKERLQLIRDCGCKELHFGIESGSQRMLDNINKGIKVENVIPALAKVIKANLVPKGSFMFGMPGETIEDVKRTIYLIMELAEQFERQIIFMNYFFYPIPGTPMTEESFMSIDVPDSVKIRYCIEGARYSGHPYKLFQHFDKEGFYSWIPDKKLFAELWFLARIISDICLPYKLRKEYNPRFKQWSLEVSPQTYDELVNHCLAGIDKNMVIRWLDRTRTYIEAG